MGFSKFMLRLFGWKVICTVPDYPKCIICVAPHTSNWDFVLGKFAYWSVGRHAGFIIKDSWFFFPMNLLFKALGGIPVARGKGSSLTQALVRKFNDSTHLSIAITPEGTRQKVEEWHTGFLRIATDAGVPVVLGVIDATHKEVHLEKSFMPTGDIEADMKAVRAYYAPFKGIKPENS
ncbi:MAG: 1-acyl-sn-glycerol-3-phosphate acyltransferase [Muribaculaceae bacterium]|nr:1-acyl-sn-glycerol-3-phosphate acyltransferase [Muribaculaceae bacterium]